jgi:hypothetical protein
MRLSYFRRGWTNCGRGLPIVVALLALVVTGCGVSGTVGTSTGPQGTVQGKVVASPACPVERADQPCQPTPVPGRSVSITTPGGTVAATVTTDAQGQFAATLAPGAYVVKVAIITGKPGLRQLTPGDVTVVAGKTTLITITLDTGIRRPSTP